MLENQTKRPWDVFLLGGASGAGKTSLSYRLARHFDVALTEVDDFLEILKCMTTPEQQPAIHFWDTHPNPHTLTPEAIAAQGLTIGEVMIPALAAVIINHCETQTPVVLEGDFIIPALVEHPTIAPLYQTGQVRIAFVHEEEESQLLANFLLREPEAGPQHFRAQVSWQFSQWIKRDAERYNVPVLDSRPWSTALERLIALAS